MLVICLKPLASAARACSATLLMLMCRPNPTLKSIFIGFRCSSTQAAMHPASVDTILYRKSTSCRNIHCEGVFSLMGLTLGYKASAEQFGPRQLIDFAVSAERNGFDSVVV